MTSRKVRYSCFVVCLSVLLGSSWSAPAAVEEPIDRRLAAGPDWMAQGGASPAHPAKSQGVEPKRAPAAAPAGTPQAPPGTSPGQAANPPCKTGARVWDGDLGYEIVTVGPVVGAVNGGYYQVVYCPSGKKVIGGGFSLNSGAVSWHSSTPYNYNAWAFSGRTEGSMPASAFFKAICICAP